MRSCARSSATTFAASFRRSRNSGLRQRSERAFTASEMASETPTFQLNPPASRRSRVARARTLPGRGSVQHAAFLKVPLFGIFRTFRQARVPERYYYHTVAEGPLHKLEAPCA